MPATLHTPGSRSQRGLTLILMLVILTLGTTYVIVQQMNALAQRLGQDRATSDALAQAKQALIGYAAQYGTRPGALPCPDNDNNGWADDQQVPSTNCNQPNERVGRLPWKTLGLPDLRDSAGERLWYAISDSLRDKGVVNSNTAGELTLRDDVTSTVVGSYVVAIVFAPGAQVSGQDRSGAADNSPNKLNVANYLEGKNNYTQDAGGINDNVFVQPRAVTDHTVQPPVDLALGACMRAGGPSEDQPSVVKMRACTDRALPITHSDLFSVVENMVARRFEIEIKPEIRTYFTTFGAYPFPRTFTDPDAAASTTWSGTAGSTSGQLPMTTSRAMFTWVTVGAGAPTMAVTGGSAWIWSGPNCAASMATRITCTIRYSCGAPTVTLTARVGGVGLGFSMFTDPYTSARGKLNLNHFIYNGETMKGTGIGSTASHVVTFGALNSDGSESMQYAASLANRSDCWDPITRTLTLDSVSSFSFVGGPPFVSALTQTLKFSQAGYSTDWYIRNEWYKLVLYSVAAGFAPGGAGSCSSPNCLTVNNLTAPNNDKGVIGLLAGRPIGPEDRSTSAARGNVANYFEGENATPGDRIFELTTRSLTFNDKVVVVAP